MAANKPPKDAASLPHTKLSKPAKSGIARSGIERRHFLAGALTAGPALGLAAGSLQSLPVQAADAPAATARGARSVPAVPNLGPEVDPPKASPYTVAFPGSDYMLDVIKTLDFDFVCATPGSSFRGLQETLLTYGDNKKPEWISVMHEDTSVAVAHGYAKMAGKPMLVLLHGVVGLGHAPMAIYNAYCDQASIVMIAGNTADEGERRPNADWQHSAHDQATMVRDMVKWDDQPYSMQGFNESMVRAYDIATTAPLAPVLLVCNGELMENELPPEERKKLSVPKLKERFSPQGDLGAVREAAKWLVNAENPVVIADRYARTFEGMALLVKFAELLQIPVIDRFNRMNFPNRHPLCMSLGGGGLVRQADVVLVLEPQDIFGILNDMPDVVGAKPTSKLKPGAKVINLGLGMTGLTKSNYNAFMRYSPTDLVIAGDAQATMLSLIEAVGMELQGPQKDRARSRGQKYADMGPRFRDAQRKAAAVGWDASPITTARWAMELWEQIKGEDWAAGSLTDSVQGWATSLWNFDKPYQAIGSFGGGGMGYHAPAAVGAALANRDTGRITIGMSGDGSFNTAPGCMWTAAQHKLPLLMMVANNGAYHQEVMHIQRMADQRSRPLPYGTGCEFGPNRPNYAKIAQGYGCYAEGPVSDPKELGPAIKRALAVVKRGEPAFIDVVCQGR